MPDETAGADTRPLTPVFVILIFVLAVVATAVFPRQVFSGDPGQYSDRMDVLFEGHLPYVDAEFEHLPLAIAPMAAAKLVADALPGDPYHYVFAALSAIAIALTAAAVRRGGDALGRRNAGPRLLFLVATIAPIAIFRLDAWSAALAAFAMAALLDGREGRTLTMAAAGTLFKGWPVAIAPLLWLRGWRRSATLLVVFGILLLGGLSLTDGFRTGREFSGVHQETLSGSAVLAWRSITGADPGFVTAAGAVYVEVGKWALAVNAAVGAALAAWGLSAMRFGYRPSRAPALAGASTGALMLASPLLSAQFLVWLMPLAALAAGFTAMAALAASGLATTVLLGAWYPASGWWPLLLVGRNILLVIAIAALCREAGAADGEGLTESAGLPVAMFARST